MRRLMITAVVLGMLAAGRAEAGLVLTVQASPGVDLNNIRVGDVFSIDTFLSGDDPDEHLVTLSGGGTQSNTNINGQSFRVEPTAFGPLTTNPLLFRQPIRAVAEGTALYRTNYLSGTIQTNLASYSVASNILQFEVLPVATPEPATLASAASGLLALGLYGWRRRRSRGHQIPTA